MSKKIRLLLLCVFFLSNSLRLYADEPDFPEVNIPVKKLFVSERLVYRIRYLGLTIGKAEALVKEIVPMENRKAYHIVVTVRSNQTIDLVYKVRDEHHSYIDTETMASLRYEAKIHEGRRRREETVLPDPEKPNMQDQLSCGYWFRTLEVQPDSTVSIPVIADGKNWNLGVKLLKIKPMRIKGVGTFQALEAEPDIRFQGIFVKRGKITGWISMDERRIPLRMKVKIPVLGSVSAELAEYRPGMDSRNSLD